MPDQPDPQVSDGPVVYQPRCVFCHAEHYAPAVHAISHGEAGCDRCRRVPPVFTSFAAYQAAVRSARQQTAARPTPPVGT